MNERTRSHGRGFRPSTHPSTDVQIRQTRPARGLSTESSTNLGRGSRILGALFLRRHAYSNRATDRPEFSISIRSLSHRRTGHQTTFDLNCCGIINETRQLSSEMLRKLQNINCAYIVEKVSQRDVLLKLYSDHAISRHPPVIHRASAR